MPRFLPYVSAVGLLALSTYCGSSPNNNQVGGSAGGGNADALAAQQASSSADDASSADNATPGDSSKALFVMDLADHLLDHTAQRYAGIGADFNGTLSFTIGTCTGQVSYDVAVTTTGITIQASDIFSDASCTGDIKLAGTQNITITTDANYQNRQALVTSTLTRTLSSAQTITMGTLDPTVGYTYKLQSSGTPTNGDVNVIVAINEHRVRSNNGTAVFDHNITTPSNTNVLVIAAFNSDGSAKSRTIASGQIDVHHNLDDFTAKHTFSNLYHDVGGCACPSSGSIEQVVVSDANDWAYTRTYAFTGCGQATVVTTNSSKTDTANGTATINWENCSN